MDFFTKVLIFFERFISRIVRNRVYMTKILRKVRQKAYFPYLLSIIWTLIISYLSLAQIPDNKDIKLEIPHLDKIVHFAMYFIYTLLLLFETKINNKKSAIAIIALYSILFGITMELCQMYVFTYSSGDLFDGLFNTLGTITGIIVFNKIKRFIRT